MEMSTNDMDIEGIHRNKQSLRMTIGADELVVIKMRQHMNRQLVLCFGRKGTIRIDARIVSIERRCSRIRLNIRQGWKGGDDLVRLLRMQF